MPVNFRKDIRERLKRLDKSIYWLASITRGKVNRSAIYNYLRTKAPAEMGADKLEIVLNALAEAEAGKDGGGKP